MLSGARVISTNAFNTFILYRRAKLIINDSLAKAGGLALIIDAKNVQQTKGSNN